MALTEEYARAHFEARNVLDRTGKSPEQLAAEVERLRHALMKHAILHHHRLAEGGGTVPSGYSCEICGAECDQGQPLNHSGDCPLVGITLT